LEVEAGVRLAKVRATAIGVALVGATIVGIVDALA